MREILATFTFIFCAVSLIIAPPLSADGTEQERLVHSGPIIVQRNGQLIENVRISATGEAAITVIGFRDVHIRNVAIHHIGGPGILCINAPGIRVERVAITHGAPRRGDKNPNNIECQYSKGLVIKEVRLRGGASGIYILESENAYVGTIEGYNFVGGLPRGQLVQFDKSDNCILEDFSVRNYPSVSWSEDNVSVYESDHCVVRRGVVDGNNSPSGVGVMFERSFDGLVEDVDAIRQGNGAFSAYPGFRVIFRRTHVRDNICVDQGRGAPLSGALVWAGSPNSQNLRIEESKYTNICNPHNLVWFWPAFDFVEVSDETFSTRRPIINRFVFDEP